MGRPLPVEESPLQRLDLEQWRHRLHSLSSRLNLAKVVAEPAFTSRTPVLGPLIVAVRRLWNWMSTKWYVRPILEQQNRFNSEVVRACDELASMVVELSGQVWELRRTILPYEGAEVDLRGEAEASGLLGMDDLADVDDEVLWQWENAGVPAHQVHSCEMEVQADERQGEEETLNYPLYWRDWEQSWPYLFSLALAGEGLACRPGDLVLDYAAGSCWVTEFLNRLSIRTVALDISHEMLRRGRRRLRSDRRLNQAVEAHFTAADALHIPFADSSFDGVICMNAFHHMPSYREALAEIYRVLKPGGRAVFSEPGAGHARTPGSQTRMKEEGVLEKSVPLPLVALLAKRVGFAEMKAIPLGHPSSYMVNYTAGPADVKALREMWEKAIAGGLSSQAFFVLQKGPGRPLDSRMSPRTLVTHLLRAQIALLRTCPQVRVGEPFTDLVQVRNVGDIHWLAQEQPFGGQVAVGMKICTEDGRLIRDDLGRTPLPRDLSPGEEAQVELHVPALLEPGRYLLKYDMVVEYVTWFEQYGSTATERFLEVVGA